MKIKNPVPAIATAAATASTALAKRSITPITMPRAIPKANALEIQACVDGLSLLNQSKIFPRNPIMAMKAGISALPAAILTSCHLLASSSDLVAVVSAIMA